MITLNLTGSMIWQQLADGRPPEQIADTLSLQFGIPREQAEVDATINDGRANGRALASGDGRLFDFGARSFLLRELRVGGRD